MRTGFIGIFVVGAILAVALIPGGSGDAAFPGVNGQMVFSRQSGSSQLQLYTRQANGSFAVPLTDPVGADDLNAAWSADGTLLAFERWVSNEPDIWLVHSNGSNPAPLPGGEEGRRPSWAPDGKQLVFELEPDLFKINVDGSDLMNLTMTLDTPAYEADWSPDGEQIVFKTQLGIREPLMLMDSDGSNVEPLEDLDGAFEDGNPDWSPDGSQIVFDFYDVSTGSVDIVTVNADGTDRANLTEDVSLDTNNPVWSPDGDQILYENHTVDGRSRVGAAGFAPTELYRMDADGSNKANITQDSLVVEVDPDWGSSKPLPTPTPIPGQNVVWGDNRCDGTLDATDGLAVLRHVAALSALSQMPPCPTIELPITVLQPGFWGDVDCDQDVDTVDDLKVLRVIAGFKVEQPVNCYPIGLEGAVIHY